MTKDLYATITASLIERIEANPGNWTKGWDSSGLALRTTGEPYKGVNQLILGVTSAALGYSSPFWLTFKQGQADGLKVKKGEKGTMVTYFTLIKKENPESPEDSSFFPLLKSFYVFNLDQFEGERPAKYIPRVLTPLELERVHLDALEVFNQAGAVVNYGGERAFYSPQADAITLPLPEAFHSAGDFLATYGHELIHWTGHPEREKRDFNGRFGSEAYAFEELVAELGAAFLLGSLGIQGDHFENHAAYLSSWLKVLKNDKKAIFKASSLAQKAADLILKKEEKKEPEELPAEELLTA